MSVLEIYDHRTHGDNATALPLREQMKVRLIEINRELNMMREHSSSFEVVKSLGNAIMEIHSAFAALEKIK